MHMQQLNAGITRSLVWENVGQGQRVDKPEMPEKSSLQTIECREKLTGLLKDAEKCSLMNPNHKLTMNAILELI